MNGEKTNKQTKREQRSNGEGFSSVVDFGWWLYYAEEAQNWLVREEVGGWERISSKEDMKPREKREGRTSIELQHNSNKNEIENEEW